MDRNASKPCTSCTIRCWILRPRECQGPPCEARIDGVQCDRSVAAGSSSWLLTPSNCLKRMVIGCWTPSSATEVLQDIVAFSITLAGVSMVRAGGALVSSVASLEILRRWIATSAATRGNASFNSTSRESFFSGRCDCPAWIIPGTALTADEHHFAARSIKQHFVSVEQDS